MNSTLLIIIGSVLIVACVLAVIYSIRQTPENLRGFYGRLFYIIAFIGVVGGAITIIVGISI